MNRSFDSGRSEKLSTLSRLRATEAEREKSFVAIQEESDRGVALIVAAELDNAVVDAISVEWDHLTPEESNLLLGGDGPLAGFAAKIRLGYAIGLYGSATQNDLLVISKIRNIFAHSPRPLDFDHPSIVEACNTFKVPASYSIAGISYQKTGFNSEHFPRGNFILVCYMIASALAVQSANELKRKTRIVEALIEPIEAGFATADYVNRKLQSLSVGRIP